jgi:hypothetical protein
MSLIERRTLGTMRFQNCEFMALPEESQNRPGRNEFDLWLIRTITRFGKLTTPDKRWQRFSH